MSTKLLTPEMVEKLNSNPFVRSVTNRRIEYTNEFKKHFVEEYRKGKNPRVIFIEAGFDVKALGTKRIERASDRWRQMNNEGRFSDKVIPVEVHPNAIRNPRKNMA